MNYEEFRNLRKAAGLSIKQACELSGCQYQSWQKWETGGARVPPLAVMFLQQRLVIQELQRSCQELLRLLKKT